MNWLADYLISYLKGMKNPVVFCGDNIKSYIFPLLPACLKVKADVFRGEYMFFFFCI